MNANEAHFVRGVQRRIEETLLGDGADGAAAAGTAAALLSAGGTRRAIAPRASRPHS